MPTLRITRGKFEAQDQEKIEMRDPVITDITAVLQLSAEMRDTLANFALVSRIGAETCGYRLLTILQYDETAGEVVRRFSSDPQYPVGGRKALAQYPANHAAIAANGYFLAATRGEVRQAYADHERLFAMGITSILNAPIRHAGRRLGTLNFSGTEGQYGPREVAIARTLAAMLVPNLLRME